MQKKPEMIFENRVDQIVKEAEERLNRFYSVYGEDAEDGSRKKKKKATVSKEIKLSSSGPPVKHTKTKIIYRPVPLTDRLPNVFDNHLPAPLPPTKPEELPKEDIPVFY